MLFPPFETDSWPACRPLVEWASRLLPTGGTGYPRPEWTDDDLAALAERFLGSAYGVRLDTADHRARLETVLWFGTDYGPGAPCGGARRRWRSWSWIGCHERSSPTRITWRSSRRCCARSSGSVTGSARSARSSPSRPVDEFEPEYQRIIRSARPQGPEALLAAMGALDPDLPTPEFDDLDDGEQSG